MCTHIGQCTAGSEKAPHASGPLRWHGGCALSVHTMWILSIPLVLVLYILLAALTAGGIALALQRFLGLLHEARPVPVRSRDTLRRRSRPS